MKSLATNLVLVLGLIITLLSRKEFQVEGQECTINCAGFFAKALFCQNKDHFDIPVDIPTIGVDPVVDDCLCVQSVVEPLRTCAACRARNGITPYDVTWTFINACNARYPQRQLFLPPGSAGSRITNPFGSSFFAPESQQLARPRSSFIAASYLTSPALLILLGLTVGLTLMTDLLTY